MIGVRKKISKQPPPVLTASTVGPYAGVLVYYQVCLNDGLTLTFFKIRSEFFLVLFVSCYALEGRHG